MNHIESCIIHYQKNYKERKEEEWNFYKELQTIEQVIKISTKAKNKEGKKLRHQQRIPNAILNTMAEKLISKKAFFENAVNFQEIIELIEKESIKGFGDLAIYDTATRIASKLNIEPEYLYLHAGTREGAKYLGLEWNSKFLLISDLPVEFQQAIEDKRIKIKHVEDILCIYKLKFQYLNKH